MIPQTITENIGGYEVRFDRGSETVSPMMVIKLKPDQTFTHAVRLMAEDYLFSQGYMDDLEQYNFALLSPDGKTLELPD